jgi:hypothetical protein
MEGTRKGTEKSSRERVDKNKSIRTSPYAFAFGWRSASALH